MSYKSGNKATQDDTQNRKLRARRGKDRFQDSVIQQINSEAEDLLFTGAEGEHTRAGIQDLAALESRVNDLEEFRDDALFSEFDKRVLNDLILRLKTQVQALEDNTDFETFDQVHIR